MAAAAEFGSDLADIDLRDSTAGDQVDPVTHPDQSKKGVKIFHDHETSDQQGKLVDIVGGRHLGHNNIDPLDGIGAGCLDHGVQKGDLAGGEFLRDKLRDPVQISALLKQPGHGVQIFGGRGVKGERAGVFMDGHGHNSGLILVDGDPFFPEDIDKYCRGRAYRPDHLKLAMQIIGSFRMVVVDVDGQAGIVKTLGKFADPFGLPCINQDQPADLF